MWQATVDAADVSKPHRLSEKQVAILVRSELRKQGLADRFSLRKPSFQLDRGTWWVFLIQRKAPYAIDGDKLAEVSDKSEKVCLQQAIAVLPEPCA
jgi:hypothetical protein